MKNITNISSLLKETAKKKPYKRAVVYPSGVDNKKRIQYSHITFKQLDEDSDKVALGLREAGIERGTKTIFMVTQVLNSLPSLLPFLKLELSL